MGMFGERGSCRVGTIGWNETCHRKYPNRDLLHLRSSPDPCPYLAKAFHGPISATHSPLPDERHAHHHTTVRDHAQRQSTVVDTRLSLSFHSSSLSSSCAPPQRPRAVRSVLLRHHPVPVLLPPFSLPHPRHILAPGASYYHPFLLIPHEALFPKPPFAPLSALPIHSNTPPALRASGFTLLSFLTRLTPSPTLALSSSSCNPSLLFPFLTSSFSPPLVIIRSMFSNQSQPCFHLETSYQPSPSPLVFPSSYSQSSTITFWAISPFFLSHTNP